VYVMHAGFQGIAASLTIDGGGQSVTATLPPPTPPSYQTPNVTLFDLQSLPNADHTATINLLGWDDGTTSLYFDYALINEGYVKLLVSPSIITLPSSPTITVGTLQTLTTQSTTASSTSTTVGSTFIDSSYTSGAASAISDTESRFVPSHKTHFASR